MSATQIGLLYSTATGVVLRTINPDNKMGDAHLDWLDQHKPAGTTLLRLNKKDVGADELNCPNLDFLIPHVKQNHAIDIAFGKSCAVIDANNKVVDVVLACPVLYQAKLDGEAAKFNTTKLPHSLTPDAIPSKVMEVAAEIGDVFDAVNNVIIPAELAIDQTAIDQPITPETLTP